MRSTRSTTSAASYLALASSLPGSLSSPASAQAISSVSSSTSQWNLDAANFSFNMPTETLNSDQAQSWIRKNWDLAAKIDWGGSNIVFSPDPSTTSNTLVRRASSSRTSSATASSTQPVTSPASTNLAGQPPVSRIEYPQGSYSKRTGGTQFYAAPLNSTSSGQGQVQGNSTTDGQYERMSSAYDVWFPSGFAWTQGGKSPGLRGGPDIHGCSGGNETDGTTCFSTRLMWRPSGAGEVYAYIPTTQSNFCSQSQVTCNSDFGTSLARGSFTFATGQWQTIYSSVVLNSDGVANGVVQSYYNGALAMSFNNLVIRKSQNLASIGGMFFSTFFGGDDATWATPTTQYTYFRNFQSYAGYGASNGTGSSITAKGAAGRSEAGRGVVISLVLASAIGMSGMVM